MLSFGHFGQKVSLNDQIMLHGVLVKSDVLFARIRPAERPLTVSGPFTGITFFDQSNIKLKILLSPENIL